MCVLTKPVGVVKKKQRGGAYLTKPGGIDACPAEHKGVCCGGTKEWGVKEADGPGDLDKKTGERNWFCRACGDELDVPTAVGDFIDGKGRAEFNKRAALKRLKEREAMAARIAEHQK